MTIEELPGSGGPERSTESAWTATVLTLGAGVALGALMMLAIAPSAVPAPSAGPSPSVAVAQASLPPASARATPAPENVVGTRLVASARQSLSVDGVSFSFTVPTLRWVRYGALYIGKTTRGAQDAEAMIFWARHPVGRYAHACGNTPGAPIGSTAAQVAESLATDLPGTDLVAGPTEVTVGGVAASEVVLFVRDMEPCGPGYFYTWDGEESRGRASWGGPMLGDTMTIWVLDKDGQPFIIAAESHLNAGPELEAELQQIVDSIRFETPETDPMGGDYTLGRHATTVDSTTLSFAIATGGWEPYPDDGALGNIHISKSSTGPQDAEEVIYWAGYGQSYDHVMCARENPADPPSAQDVAARVASAPGADLVTGPEETLVGGHRAIHVVITVRAALGCDPGFFYNWVPRRGGALWTRTGVGDTIRVWVVEVDAGRLFFIGAISTPDAAQGDGEIQQIIDSIQFE